jgi:hypothetical protein
MLYPHTLNDKAVTYIMLIVQNFVVPCFVLLVYNNLNRIIFKVENSKVNECDTQNSAE